MRIEKGNSKFVLCVRNGGSDDLEPRKVYQTLSDRSAVNEGLVRVIDESGEDYLYPAEYFVPVRLPVAIARGFASPSRSQSQSVARRARRG
jgi:hypothetical protein